ncbi:MAG TPA: hypothetical protein DEF75_02180 [Comamonas kerstersii]|nr:MAG TPA: hypothetical protein [Caudoviricetes sp.]HBW61196.1 hypothetical protein [Comamonas kerstersii]
MGKLALVICFLITCAGGWFGQKVPFANQWPMYEALRTTAAIIFAVIGAWMAIIYPERLRLSYKSPDEKSDDKADAAGELFTPVVNSTCVLVIVLLTGVIAPVLKAHGLPGPITLWRGISYALLVALTLWQVWTVALTLNPADRMKSFMDKDLRHQRNLDALKSRADKP